jgi:hypothetical protein
MSQLRHHCSACQDSKILFDLLHESFIARGFQVSPRRRGLGSRKLERIENKAPLLVKNKLSIRTAAGYKRAALYIKATALSKRGPCRGGPV